jgi:glycosyltransferase involved in cell wall biosynthesis
MEPAKSRGAVAIWSNSPHQPTGYGQQAGYLVDSLKRDGFDVAAISNYGLEGNNSVYHSPYGDVPHYARGYDAYSMDVLPIHYKHFTSQFDAKDLLITLYDVWVLKGKALDSMNIASWTPLDHTTVPPKVRAWLEKDNVKPITMAPNGGEMLEKIGIDYTYIPHGIDTKVFKPTTEINGQDAREFMGIKPDQFLVGMVAANKANGSIHRKAFAENFLAFSLLLKKYPDAVLYVHSEPFGFFGGFNLLGLAEAVGIPQESILFPNQIDLRYGFERVDMAGIYSAMDVLLACSLGEGFGVPTVEAQACGTRVIGSGWAATKDLVSADGWLVDGQPLWDEAQKSWFKIPNVAHIYSALVEAYEADRGVSQKSLEFASQFDVEHVWTTHWLPALDKFLA